MSEQDRTFLETTMLAVEMMRDPRHWEPGPFMEALDAMEGDLLAAARRYEATHQQLMQVLSVFVPRAPRSPEDMARKAREEIQKLLEKHRERVDTTTEPGLVLSERVGPFFRYSLVSVLSESSDGIAVDATHVYFATRERAEFNTHALLHGKKGPTLFVHAHSAEVLVVCGLLGIEAPSSLHPPEVILCDVEGAWDRVRRIYDAVAALEPPPLLSFHPSNAHTLDTNASNYTQSALFAYPDSGAVLNEPLPPRVYANRRIPDHEKTGTKGQHRGDAVRGMSRAAPYKHRHKK